MITDLKLIFFLILFSATDDNEDDFDENGDVFDDAASSASTLPIAQACPNTLSVALRQEQINHRTDTWRVPNKEGLITDKACSA